MAQHKQTQQLANMRILLGITGGIAAYKSAELVRGLRAQGAQVQVVMTHSAQQFITPLTLQALSGKPVRTQLWDDAAEAAMGHIELARWADAIIIAPASANCIAQLTHGMADDLLTTLCLATTAPIYLAPAMNQQMWQHAATQQNCQTLQERGVQIIGPAVGEQACGEVGPGRMVEPEEIISCIVQAKINSSQGILAGKRIVITAGPTREAIDPVRFISNHSSGKMGFALAEQAARLGAQVILITGPVKLATPPNVQRVDVVTAQDMYEAVLAYVSKCDIFIGAAAVADYRPNEFTETKLAKQQLTKLDLIPNPDIIASVAQLTPSPFTVGFAAQTHDVKAYAKQKLQQKNINMIAANQVSETLGFYQDDNALTVLWSDEEFTIECASKILVAKKLLELIAKNYALTRGIHNEAQTTS